LRRGDIITVAVSGDYGEPRPALVIQSDFLAETDSVLVCLLTTTFIDAPLHRLTVLAEAETGLRPPSQVMVDKVIAVRRDRCGAKIGRVDQTMLQNLGTALAFVVGLAD
jgi:mRNA interferase MazF